MQQINLFHAQFKPKTVILPARQLVILSVLVIVILAVISLYSYQRNLVLEQANASQQQYVAQQNVNEDLDKPLLIAELAKVQQQQQEKENLLAYLTDQSFGNQFGFSGTLVTLSQQVISKVWLTEFSLLKGGEVMTLQGQTTQISQIPVYIDSLAKSNRFQGKQFSALQLEHPDENAELYTFELNTGASEL